MSEARRVTIRIPRPLFNKMMEEDGDGKRGNITEMVLDALREKYLENRLITCNEAHPGQDTYHPDGHYKKGT